jgi:integrase
MVSAHDGYATLFDASPRDRDRSAICRPHISGIERRFALAMGLQDANVRGLRWEYVDLGRRVACIWREAAKAGEPIPVPLSDVALAVLQGCLGQHPTHVFTNAKNCEKGTILWRQPMTSGANNSGFRNAHGRAGLPALRRHDLRHSWAAWRAQAETPAIVLQALGGWKVARMVRTDMHPAAIDSWITDHANAIRLPAVSPTVPVSTDREIEANLNAVSGVADGIRNHHNRNHKA